MKTFTMKQKKIIQSEGKDIKILENLAQLKKLKFFLKRTQL